MKNHPYIQSLLHIFFPHVCAGCGNDFLQTGEALCLHCINHLPLTNFHGIPNNPVEKIFQGRLPIEEATSYLYFTKDSLLQRLLHQLKYKSNKTIGYYFGKAIGEALRDCNRFTCIDALVPLPLHIARERHRGYNQSALLCQGISSILNIPVWDNIIKRHPTNSSQTSKTRIERWQHIQGKFELVKPQVIYGKHLLLVDDIVTTGATLESCGQELLTAGNVRLSICTMALAIK